MVSRNHGVDDGSLPSRLVALQGFFLAVTVTLFTAVTAALFLQAHGSEQLPQAYLLTGGAVLLFHRAFLSVEYRLPVGATVVGALACGAVLVWAAWAMVIGVEESDGWVLYPALAVVPVVALYWTLAEDTQLGLFYDLRQLSAVLPRVLLLAAAGAVVAAGLLPLVLLIAPLDGLLAVAAFVALMATAFGLLLVVNYASTFASRPALGNNQAVFSRRGRSENSAGAGEVVRDRFVRLLLVHEMARTTAVFLIQFLFLDVLFFRLADDADALAITVAGAIAGATVIGTGMRILIGKATLLRFGLRFGLVAGPGVIVLVVAGLLLLPAVGPSVEATKTGLGLVAAIWALERCLGLAATGPSILVAKRMLPARLRFVGLAGIEGEAPAAGAALAGALLLLTAQVADLTEGTVGVIVGIASAFWLLAAVMLSHRYRTAIEERLAQRSLTGLDVPVETAESHEVAERLVDGSSPADTMLGLDMLAAVGDIRYHAALLRLLKSADDRRTLINVLDRVSQERPESAIELLEPYLDEQHKTEVRVAAMAALVACEPYGGGATLEPLLESEERAIREGAVLALLQGAVLRHHDVALGVLNELVTSQVAKDRSAAAVILGQTGPTGHRELLATLLTDSNLDVRSAAIEAVGLLDLSGHTPFVLAALGEPRTRAAASGAITRFGNGAVAGATEALGDPTVDDAQAVRIVRALSADQTHGATSLLGAKLGHSSAAVRASVITGLIGSPYLDSARLTLPARMNRMVRPVLDAEAARVEELFTAIGAIPEGPEFELLTRAVAQQAESHVVNVFNLMAIRYRRPELAATNAQILTGGKPADLAKELIDSVAADRDRLMIAALLGQRQRAKPGAHGPDGDLDQVLSVCDDDWTAATAVYGAALAGRSRNLDPEMIRRPDEKIGSHHRAALSWSRRRVIAKAGGTSPGPEPDQNGRKLVMPMVEKVDLLRRCLIFAETPDRSLVEVAELAEQLTLGPGDPLQAAGEPVDALFVVVAGELETTDDEERVYGPDAVIGELDILSGVSASADVVAKTTAEVLSLRRAALQTLIEERPELALQVIRALAVAATTSLTAASDTPEPNIDLTEPSSDELSASADLS